jgi:signal transduction histidine kinase
MVLGGLVSVIILAIILFRNNRNKQKANLLLQQQKKEIDKKAGELAEQKDNLEQSYRNVELLGEIGRKITSSLSVETIISTVYDNVNSLMDASVFGIGIYHDDTRKIEFPATYENGVALPAYTNSVYEENRFASLCFISGKEIVMGDLQTEYKNYLQNVPVPKQGQQPVSLIYLPLKVKEKIQGVITVQSFQKNAYTDYQLYMLRNIAIYAAIALENADSFKKLNQTVHSLKKTQTQLIQSEKMASLGELTAGIAHEIQNPLNFVNNFSEVNAELIDELEQEINNGNLDEIRSIAKDIKENEQKIIHHGKRADAIVKGMLLHSRSSSGQKELVDINALADEYLRLAYHGLRAKDKSFNASFKTNLDNSIDKVNIIPQDIGRVLVNLINNAFYAVGEKRKQTSNGYEPTVTVTTKKIDGKVEVSVKDNGNGIPQKVLDKIFQPFFTTKPTGEGTGLGLSLSYDIVTKGHGGELKVETKEGEGSEFIIIL